MTRIVKSIYKMMGPNQVDIITTDIMDIVQYIVQ